MICISAYVYDMYKEWMNAFIQVGMCMDVSLCKYLCKNKYKCSLNDISPLHENS